MNCDKIHRLNDYNDLTLDWTKQKTVGCVFESFNDLETLVLTTNQEDDGYIIKLESDSQDLTFLQSPPKDKRFIEADTALSLLTKGTKNVVYGSKGFRADFYFEKNELCVGVMNYASKSDFFAFLTPEKQYINLFESENKVLRDYVRVDHDRLHALFLKDPDLYETKRKELVEEFISKQPLEKQEGLRALQWMFDKEVEKSKTPLGKLQIAQKVFFDNLFCEGGLIDVYDKHIYPVEGFIPNTSPTVKKLITTPTTKKEPEKNNVLEFKKKE
ncbi:DUF3135 domain-containing protein [Candidatus Woesearchaeota archaeon]|nr:DUF3135 domain-containing protein [Candidatus Woesearchaeota archaeon]